MNTHTLRDYAALYGSDWKRWPADVRYQAESLLLNDASAEAALALEEALDRRLRAFPSAVPSDLSNAIIKAAEHMAQKGAPSHRRSGQAWRAVASLVIFLGGLVAGTYFQQPSSSEEIDWAWLLFEDGGIQ